MTNAEQLYEWINAGAKLKIIPVGSQAQLFGGESRMIAVLNGKASLTVTRQELDLAVSKANAARKLNDEPIFGVDGNFAFEDAEPLTLNGPGEER